MLLLFLFLVFDDDEFDVDVDVDDVGVKDDPDLVDDRLRELLLLLPLLLLVPVDGVEVEVEVSSSAATILYREVRCRLGILLLLFTLLLDGIDQASAPLPYRIVLYRCVAFQIVSFRFVLYLTLIFREYYLCKYHNLYCVISFVLTSIED